LSQWAPPSAVLPVVAGPFGDGVLLAESNGYHATDRAVLERLSAGTVAASVFWNVNSASRLSYAVDGVVMSYLDFIVDGDDQGTDPSAAQPFRAGLGSTREDAVVFLERVAGARLTPDWLAADHPASLIVPPSRFAPVTRLEAVLPGVLDHHWNPTSRAGSALPEEARSALHARAAARAEAMRAAAELAAARVAPPEAPLPEWSSLSDRERSELSDRLLLAARESYRQGLEWFWEEPEEDAEPTGGGLDDLLAEREAAEAESHRARQRAHGWAAARERLRTDPREALRGVLTQARAADPAGWPALEREVRALLTAAITL
jgi:hypothetical protein